MVRPVMVTAVVGAGPAGLLFGCTARLLDEREGGDPSRWPILLFDKRTAYQRTHRLRLDPAPFRSLQRAVGDPRMDALLDFLETSDFSPAVNRLEEQLAALAAEVGIRREVLDVGRGSGQVPVARLREHLQGLGRLPPGTPLTIVGADSVHSEVRESVRGSTRTEVHTHQTVARLRVAGAELPARLGRIDQYRLAKVLGSVVDYRLNTNGFAEVDLFLDAGAHARLEGLGASPGAPVELTPDLVRSVGSPVMERFVDHLRSGITEGACQVVLQSTFRLEHSYLDRVVFELEDPATTVFLVGDAAVSLPFFRGMACLTACVLRLARAHADLVRQLAQPDLDEETAAEVHAMALAPDRSVRVGPTLLPGRIVRIEPTFVDGDPAVVVLHAWLMRWGVHVLRRDASGAWVSVHHLAPVRSTAATRDFETWCRPERRYDAEVAAIRRTEVAKVDARARLVRGAREFARVSALVPFPLQTWFLSIPTARPAPSEVSGGVFVNAAVAVLAAVLAVGGVWLGVAVDASFLVAWWLALPVEALGGVVYRAGQEFEPHTDDALRRIWRIQIASVLAVGVAVSVALSVTSSRVTALRSAVSWFLLGVAFVVGIYTYEGLRDRLFERAGYADDVS